MKNIAASFGYSSAVEGNSTFTCDAGKAVTELARDVGERASVVASFADSAAAKTLPVATAVTAVASRGQGVFLALTVADIVINGGPAEALGATAGAISSSSVTDVLTDYGKISPNLRGKSSF